MGGSGLIVNGHSGYHPLIIQANGTEVARFKNDGNVGIGDTNPFRKLTVDGTIHVSSSDAAYTTDGWSRYLEFNATVCGWWNYMEKTIIWY